jgi:hypothetical protein
MKKSLIVMMMFVIAFSMNLFGEVVSEKVEEVEMIEKHECTAECNHGEVKKVCEPDCAMPCCAEKKLEEKHVCTDKCEMAKNHVCTDECKLDETNKTCELASLKNTCSKEVKAEGCKPVGKPAGCGQKAVQKGCSK